MPAVVPASIPVPLGDPPIDYDSLTEEERKKALLALQEGTAYPENILPPTGVSLASE
jgi:hypothetical protein